jgi:hypothetical protein
MKENPGPDSLCPALQDDVWNQYARGKTGVSPFPPAIIDRFMIDTIQKFSILKFWTNSILQSVKTRKRALVQPIGSLEMLTNTTPSGDMLKR